MAHVIIYFKTQPHAFGTRSSPPQTSFLSTLSRKDLFRAKSVVGDGLVMGWAGRSTKYSTTLCCRFVVTRDAAAGSADRVPKPFIGVSAACAPAPPLPPPHFFPPLFPLAYCLFFPPSFLYPAFHHVTEVPPLRWLVWISQQ